MVTFVKRGRFSRSNGAGYAACSHLPCECSYHTAPLCFRVLLGQLTIRTFLLAATSLGWALQAQAPLAAVLVVGFFMGLGTGTNNTGKSSLSLSTAPTHPLQRRYTAKTSYPAKAAPSPLPSVQPPTPPREPLLTHQSSIWSGAFSAQWAHRSFRSCTNPP